MGGRHWVGGGLRGKRWSGIGAWHMWLGMCTCRLDTQLACAQVHLPRRHPQATTCPHQLSPTPSSSAGQYLWHRVHPPCPPVYSASGSAVTSRNTGRSSLPTLNTSSISSSPEAGPAPGPAAGCPPAAAPGAARVLWGTKAWYLACLRSTPVTTVSPENLSSFTCRG